MTNVSTSTREERGHPFQPRGKNGSQLEGEARNKEGKRLRQMTKEMNRQTRHFHLSTPNE